MKVLADRLILLYTDLNSHWISDKVNSSPELNWHKCNAIILIHRILNMHNKQSIIQEILGMIKAKRAKSTEVAFFLTFTRITLQSY